MNGPQLTALRPLVVACAGLGGALEIDGEIAGWQTMRIAAGARLRVRGTDSRRALLPRRRRRLRGAPRARQRQHRQSAA